MNEPEATPLTIQRFNEAVQKIRDDSERYWREEYGRWRDALTPAEAEAHKRMHSAWLGKKQFRLQLKSRKAERKRQRLARKVQR